MLELCCRAAPVWKLGQGGRGLFLGTRKFTSDFNEPRIQVAGLASLADCPTEWFHIGRLFEVSPLFFLPLDLILMAGDRILRRLGLAAQLGEPLSQPANNHRFVDPEP